MSANLSDDDTARRRECHRLGMTDGQMAKRLGVSKSSILAWRRRQDLPSNGRSGTQAIGRAEHRGRMALHRLGWSDGKIGRARGVKENAIQQWRVQHGLKANVRPVHHPEGKSLSTSSLAEHDNERRLALHRNGMSDADIGRDVGRSTNAITGWRMRRGLPLNEPQRDWERGPASLVSMDADLGDGGFNRHSFIADDAAAEWLEQMGATVW